MKGRKSARGESVQSGPVQYLDVIRVQVETLCQQRAQLARPTHVFQRCRNSTTPLHSLRLLPPGGRRSP